MDSVGIVIIAVLSLLVRFTGLYMKSPRPDLIDRYPSADFVSSVGNVVLHIVFLVSSLMWVAGTNAWRGYPSWLSISWLLVLEGNT